jgi:hypothetical protein
MISVNCNLVSSRWQALVSLYTDRKETTMYMRINDTKTQNTQNVKQNIKKQENKHKTNNKKNIKPLTVSTNMSHICYVMEFDSIRILRLDWPPGLTVCGEFSRFVNHPDIY